ncbi:MAG: glycosyltransferase family 1 protein [Candidatus Falkowbacteria bacterium]
MLIGIDASRANRKQKSGTEWYAYHVIKQLAILDSENQYVLYTDKPLEPHLCNLTDQGECPVVECDRFGRQAIVSPHNNFSAKVLRWPFRFFWTLGRLSLEMLFYRPNILFVPSHVLPLIHPKKSIVTIHDVGYAREKQLYPNEAIRANERLRGRRIEWLVRFLTGGRYGANIHDYFTWSTNYTLAHAKKIICVSEFTRFELNEVYQSEKKIKKWQELLVIPNGYDDKRYNKHQLDFDRVSEVLAKYGIEPPYLCYLGRLERKKNTINLLAAFAEIKRAKPDLSLALLGSASFGYDEINYTISEYKLDHSVITPGWTDEDDVPSLLAGAAAFVFPSKYEGFGIPVLQAMACGTPVAAADIPPLHEVGGNAVAYFNPNDSHDMAQTIIQLLDNKAEQLDKIKQGYIQASKYSWQKTTLQLVQLFNRMHHEK